MVMKSQLDNSKLEEKNNYSISLINEQRTWPNSITPIQFQTLHLTLTHVYRKTHYRQTICETLIYPLKPLRLNKKKHLNPLSITFLSITTPLIINNSALACLRLNANTH